MKTLLSATLILFSLPIFAKKGAEPEFLKIAKVKQAAMRLGKAGDAVVTSTVGQGYHVQANPVSQPNLVATVLVLEPAEGFEVGEITYPEGKTYRLQNSDRDLKTYEGNFDVKVSIKASETAKAGKAEVKGKLKFQACNDKICFFPTSVPVTIPIMVYK